VERIAICMGGYEKTRLAAAGINGNRHCRVVRRGDEMQAAGTNRNGAKTYLR
jgi:hypothetical protein